MQNCFKNVLLVFNSMIYIPEMSTGMGSEKERQTTDAHLQINEYVGA